MLSSVLSRRSPRWPLDMATGLPRLVAEISRADVVHWYMTPGLPAAVDLRLASALRKASIAEFAGGDIRNPEIEALDNPYYAEVGPQYEYRRWETADGSRRRQRIFAEHHCEALVSCPSLLAYLEPGLFEHVHLVRQRVPVRSVVPSYPDPDRRRPLVVHASTAPVAKGTAWVLAAVEEVRRGIDFEFRLLEGVPHREALAIIADADVYLDQFVIGAHGGAAIEAMALGTPVVGYVKPAVAAQYPQEIPLVNATREALAGVLAELLLDGQRRHDLGRLSRAYAEHHHDAVTLASELRAIYVQAAARR
jgi:hypothetical protein